MLTRTPQSSARSKRQRTTHRHQSPPCSRMSSSTANTTLTATAAPTAAVSSQAAQDATTEAIRTAWVELEVPQCGYCQSGQILSATTLLRDTPKPTDDDIDAAMDGNLCRCATYARIRKAIHRASEIMEG